MNYSILLVLLLSLNASAETSCSEKFKRLLTPRIQVPTLIPQFMRHPSSGYENLGSWMRENNITGKSSEARKEATLIAIQELQDIGINIQEMSINNGLKITQSILKDKKITFSQIALNHPMLPFYLEELEKRGGNLRIWPSELIAEMPHSFANGFYEHSSKTLAIMPKTTWSSFIHEYNHFVFHELGLENSNWKDPNFLEEIKKAQTDFHFGLTPKEMVAIAKNNSKKNISNLALNETIATEAEVQALHQMGYGDWTFPVYEAKSYAWGYQIRDLERRIALGLETKKDKVDLDILKAKKILLHPVVLKPLVYGSGATAYYYRDDIGEVIVRYKDNTLKKFRIEDLFKN